LNAVVLHDSNGKEVHMTQPFQFTTEDLVTVFELSGARLVKYEKLDLLGKVRRQPHKRVVW